MAPNAQIVLMEAATNSNANLYAAVTAANSYIASHGGKGEVSMSWGGSEVKGEKNSDHYFTGPGVVYFASSGDSPGVIYPSSSVNVVSAGGTQVNRSGVNYTKQTAWSSGGGGDSKYEARPSFQSSISLVGTHRGTPDLSFDSSGNSPVAVYNSSCYGGWIEVTGPAWRRRRWPASSILPGCSMPAATRKILRFTEITQTLPTLPTSLPAVAARTAQAADGISARAWAW